MTVQAEYREEQTNAEWAGLERAISTEWSSSIDDASVIDVASRNLGYDVQTGWRPTPNPNAWSDWEDLLRKLLGYPVLGSLDEEWDRLRNEVRSVVARMTSDEDDPEEIARRSEETRRLLEAQLRVIRNRDQESSD